MLATFKKYSTSRLLGKAGIPASVPATATLLYNSAALLSTNSTTNDSKPSILSHLFRSGSRESHYRPELGNLHQFQFKDLDGNNFDFKTVEGKVVLITNVACDCGYTKSGYNHLVDWKNQFKDHFEVVAFPSDSFNQEKRTPEQIREFVAGYGVNFPMMAKSDVNGPNQNEIYTFLKKSFSKPGSEKDSENNITWNFSSYFLIDANGIPIARYEKESWDDITKGIAHAIEQAKKEGH